MFNENFLKEQAEIEQKFGFYARDTL